MNGLALTNASNYIAGLVDGLDFTLKKVTTSTESISIEKDTAAIEEKVQGFIDAYNAYQTTLSKLTDYTDVDGALNGDSTARRIQSSIRAVTTGALTIAGNTYTSLSDIGVTSDQYGQLTLENADFQA